jgi:PTS system mannose-specific IID component
MTAAARSYPAPDPTPHVSALTWLSVFIRTLAIQGSWNYETLLGNGVGFALEPVLRQLPGGVHTDAFKAAVTRESAYFNAHPYLASVAVGALARAELSGVPPERIERFRTAICGPLGSVGDRLVWAGWLPLSSLVALVAFGLGARPLVVVSTFVLMYNVGHFGLRIWGLYVGWTRGLAVASALANPVLRNGPAYIARAAAAVAGVAIPLAAARVVGSEGLLLDGALASGALIAVALVRVHGRVEGWKLVLVLIAVFALVSVMR